MNSSNMQHHQGLDILSADKIRMLKLNENDAEFKS